MLPFISILGRDIPTYAIMALIGALLAGVLLCRRISKLGLDDNDAIFLLLMAGIGVLAGGHILYVLTNIRHIPTVLAADGIVDFFKRYSAYLGGSVFYGGLIAGSLAGMITIRAKKLDAVVYTDSLAPVIPLFHGIARIGCFLGGCCYGIESDFGFTAHSNPLINEINGVSRFPVQLLESALNLILALVLWMLLKHSDKTGKLRGKLLGVYLASYAVIRFLDEFLRGDSVRGFIFGMSTSQFISIFIFVTGILWIVFSDLIIKYVLTSRKNPISEVAE